MFETILRISAIAENADLKAFIEHEIELLNKKKSSEKKPTTRQTENAILKKVITEYLIKSGTHQSIKDIQKNIPELHELSCQRITALLTALYDEGKGVVSRETIKRVNYYFIPLVDDEAEEADTDDKAETGTDNRTETDTDNRTETDTDNRTETN